MTGDGPALSMVGVDGTCRICGYQGMLVPHHIIPVEFCKKINRLDLISNPGNVVHICETCHDKTPTWYVGEP